MQDSDASVVNSISKQIILNVICKMIDCGQISIQAVQALSSLGYVEAKGVVEICVRNGFAKKDGDKLVPNVSFEEFISLVEKNELDFSLEHIVAKQRQDIAFLIADYTDLIPIAGKPKFFAKCPFHFEHQPSMIINVEEQSFHCFSCGLSGLASDFEALVEEKGIKKKGD